jgi:cell division cycle 14
LIGAYAIIVLKMTAVEVWEKFEPYRDHFKPFRDAIQGPCAYKMTVLDTLLGLEYAIRLRWYNHTTFDVRSYEFYEKVENGDINWIIPGKMYAFSNPSDQEFDEDGY